MQYSKNSHGESFGHLIGNPRFYEKPCQKCPSWSHGNPINAAKREKLQTESDYVGGSGQLKFVRLYSSVWQAQSPEGVSPGWRHNYSMRVLSNMTVTPAYVGQYTSDTNFGYLPTTRPSTGLPYALVVRPDGYQQYFQTSDQGATWYSDTDVSMQLASTRNADGKVVGWTVTTSGNDIESYGESGLLLSIRFADGRVLSFVYSDSTTSPEIAQAANLLIGVRDEFGQTIALAYNAENRLATMTTPSGKLYSYEYDTFSNLSRVTYPDGLHRLYHYNEPAYQLKTGAGNDGLLTGISVELIPSVINRYAIFRYNSSGWPVSTEHAGGVDKYTISYAPMSYTTPSGATYSQSYSSLNGVDLQTNQTKPSSTANGLATSLNTYDVNGNFATRTDFNGNKTIYGYDLTRNLELNRTEAYGTAYARSFTTEWHTSLRLPTRIAEPRRITALSYDANGLLLSRSEQTTTDSVGTQGFSASPVGLPRTWHYTYNSYGQILSAKGPRSDIDETTTYVYDAKGNLSSSSNALGHQTLFADYDADGRVGTITDPNGRVTTLTYTSRGLLASQLVVGETTTYAYDGADSLVQVTLPDGASVHYHYDAALRLTGITDSLGNSVTYTLDAAGNRLSEQSRDPNGTLARQTTRVFDTLGQVKQQTGGMQ